MSRGLDRLPSNWNGLHDTAILRRRRKRSTTSIETTLDEQVSAAPEPLRSYIQELEGQADPVSNLRELLHGREERKMLGLAILELEQAIRKHRDAQGGIGASAMSWRSMRSSTCPEVTRVPGDLGRHA